MAWIESHQSLSRHRKTLRAAALLQIDRHNLIGHLHELWWWALDNVPADGWLGGLTDEEIAAGAQWEGVQSTCDARAAAVFVQSLCTAGFIDIDANGERWLHDWFEYAGKLLKRRADNAERMRKARAVEAKCSEQERATHVQRTSPARAPATVPNSTVHNSIKDKSANALLERVHSHYKANIQADAKLTEKARAKMRTRVKEGYTNEQLCLAIDKFVAADPFWMEKNGMRGMAWFFDSEDRIEQFLHLPPRVKINGQGRNHHDQEARADRLGGHQGQPDRSVPPTGDYGLEERITF